MLEIQFNPFPVIETNRLMLRRITTKDAPEIFAMRSSEAIMRYIDRPVAKTIDDALELIAKIDRMIENNDGINWGIQLKNHPEIIGMISYHVIEKVNYRAEIGYLLGTEHHRKGIMQEAMTAVINFGFENLKFHSIEAKVNPANNASIGILEKNGFVREAYYKENYYWNGKFLDTGVYSLLSRQ